MGTKEMVKGDTGKEMGTKGMVKGDTGKDSND